jgi:ribosomal protein S27AE
MDKKSVASQWILCPICGKKTRIKVNEDTIIRRLPLFCPKCKQETLVDLIDHKVHICTEPDV